MEGRKTRKKLSALLLSLMLIVSMVPVAMAATPYDQDDGMITINGISMPESHRANYTEGIVEIKPSRERINSNGTFTFDVGYSITSTTFKVSSTSTRISLSAVVKNAYGTNVSSSYPNHKYTITLYKSGGWGSVAVATYYANGTSYQFDAVGLSTSDTYYFTIDNNDYLPAGTVVSGSGSISNYVHP